MGVSRLDLAKHDHARDLRYGVVMALVAVMSMLCGALWNLLRAVGVDLQ